MRDQIRSQNDIFLSLIITFTTVLLDRATKMYFADLLNLYESIPVINNIFHVTLVYNTGMAFGMFKDYGAVFIAIPIIVISLGILLAFNIYYYRKNNEALSRTYIAGFSLILGGAIGNLYDRISFGYVIDFLDFRIWPVFNIADSAITVGGVIIAIKCFQVSKN